MVEMRKAPTDYTQPFFVGFNNPRFRYAKHGYLPPIEDKPEMDLDERLEVLEEQVGLLKQPYLTARQNDTINQIKSGYIHLIRKVDELREGRKRKGKYTTYGK